MLDLFKREKKAKKAEAQKSPDDMTHQELLNYTAAITLDEVVAAQISCGMSSLDIAKRVHEMRLGNGKA